MYQNLILWFFFFFKLKRKCLCVLCVKLCGSIKLKLLLLQVGVAITWPGGVAWQVVDREVHKFTCGGGATHADTFPDNRNTKNLNSETLFKIFESDRGLNNDPKCFTTRLKPPSRCLRWAGAR